MKKPRSDAKLQALPEIAQRAIIELLRTKKQAEVRAWIEKEHGVSVSHATLTAFWQWWHSARFSEAVATDASTFRDLLQAMKQAGELDISDDSASKIGQAFFEHRSLKGEDPKLYASMKLARQRDRALALREREIVVKERLATIKEQQAAKADAADAIAKDEKLSAEEKDRRFREIFGVPA